MNCDGGIVAVSRQPPAQQCLGAGHLAGREVDLRLVMQRALVALERAQLALQHQPLDRCGIHLRRE